MRKSIITKILLSRRLYQISLENLNSDNELSLSIGVILLQDSVEIFLLAAAEHIDADVGNNTNFNKYFDLINKKLYPKELPFRFRLNSLNKLRVNAKHYGLSPSLYRKDKGSDWIVKEDFRKLDEEGIKDRAEYVLDSTINLILTKHLDLKRSKTPDYRKYFVNLKNESAPIYEKADNKSKVIGTVPASCKKVFVDSKVSALNGDGLFWHVSHLEDDLHLYGYIDNDDIE